MSWSPDLYIGELRPWPDSVHVVRGNTGETRRYMPERKDGQEALCARIDELCAEVERLHADQAHWELGNCPSCPNIADLQEALEQNAKLCAEVEALKRDEWAAGFSAGCEAVEAAYEDGKAHYEAENAKLRELVDYMTPLALYAASERERDRMRELGIEVG